MEMKLKKYHFKWLGILAIFVLFFSCGVSKSLKDIPDVSGYDSKIYERIKMSDTVFTLKESSLLKNKHGLWELYVEGDPYQLGLKTGSLTQELFHKQESAFLSKVEEFVPSKTKQIFLKKVLAWYNRKMYLNIPEEFKSEILGLSKYASNKYDYVAKNYLRVLYLHGAHDIGHALQDLALVGCSSFAAWGDKTENGNLIIGRNFDFYAGDDFAKDKIIAFVEPEEGHKFMSVTWGGMIGVVSGMNDQGLTVTINAGKSKIPLIAKTPISILTREILQYASTINEAISIAKKRQVFVSESILIGSAKDNKAVTIEVSPDNFGVYDVLNANQLICSNHFQSIPYKNDKNNIKHIKESHSKYRYDRMEELLSVNEKLTPSKAVEILRNKEGLNNQSIGLGNEKALNQLLAHHGIVFQPKEQLVWISTNPYQLGEFVAYNLNEVFKKVKNRNRKVLSLASSNLEVEEDEFQYTEAFINYEKYRVLSRKIKKAINNNFYISSEDLIDCIKLNPDYWEPYFLVGEYFYKNKYYSAALVKFKESKSKEISTMIDEIKVDSYIKKTKRKLNK